MGGFLQFYRGWARLSAKLFTLLVRGDFRQLGRHTTLQPPLRVQGAKHIEVGERVFLGPNCWLQVLDAHRLARPPAISIGSGCSLSGFCTISAARSVVIEQNVLIARYVYIADHTHAHTDPDVPIKAQGITKIAPVLVREGAWLGQGAVICPGVTIGRNAVVGANSVVRQDVPDHGVVAGVPAQIVRARPVLPAA